MLLANVLPALGFGLAFVVGFAVAIPAGPLTSETPDCPILCIDGINQCGVRFGDCYNVCEPESSPTAPPCSSTVASPAPTVEAPAPPDAYAAPVKQPAEQTKAGSSDDCRTRSVCADYINECGMMYGGCFAACRPWPTFTPPPCPSSESVSATATATTGTVVLK